MNVIKAFSLLATSCLLSGCLHVQLFGSVSDAQVTIAPLRSTSNIVDRGQSRDRQTAYELRGKKNWKKDGPERHLWTIGVFGTSQQLQDSTLYLAKATGGFDEDINTDKRLDDSGTPINGSWHAILSGEQAKSYFGKVSVVTEAIYQVINAEGIAGKSDTQIRARMDALASVVVTDLNNDGDVNYDDVLAWSRLLDQEVVGPGISALSLLALAILENSPQEDVLMLSRTLLAVDQPG